MARKPVKLEPKKKITVKQTFKDYDPDKIAHAFKATLKNPKLIVSPRPVNARRLVTIAEKNALWSGKKTVLSVGPADYWMGAIVRLRPPPEADEKLVEQIKVAIAAAGAARIKVEVQQAAVLPTEAVDKGTPTKSSAREVVLQLVAEANSTDPAALKDVCERVMAEKGL